ncbi:recombination regulator RecX [Roseateles violae]|uniref:Regulatory protein RecX n=1 Tax=Roseateles violae TaxID=3058042 RepID=A0ABT8DKJ8_9BURK|nr:recombination regulator RecX [Pelomonas sp. PFR6]MDN3918940.1 recombination regulator RecX [Pelomonas sp. PFR6]
MKPLSLKARAIALLSQREHSRAELRRKLWRIAQAAPDAGDGDPDAAAEQASAEVDALLDWLQTQGYLSEARFVESRLHARTQRYGSLRIRQELAQHGLALDERQQAELGVTEFERARLVWRRKFGVGPSASVEGQAMDPAQRAKQIRFLTVRGFAPEIVRRVLRAADGSND